MVDRIDNFFFRGVQTQRDNLPIGGRHHHSAHLEAQKMTFSRQGGKYRCSAVLTLILAPPVGAQKVAQDVCRKMFLSHREVGHIPNCFQFDLLKEPPGW